MSVLLGPDGFPIIDMNAVEKELESAQPEPYRYDPMGNLLVDEFDGVRETLHFDEGEDSFTVQMSGDAEPIIEANKRLQSDGYTGMSKDKSMKHVATIDPVTQRVWEREYGLNWSLINHDPDEEKKLTALLNDPDWRLFRTGGGRV